LENLKKVFKLKMSSLKLSMVDYFLLIIGS